ncbi:MAG: helix-turn-helix transcriptional regulator [Phycisphaerales bacterium]|nr:PAS domain-containing protein [Planctomycetota bacterium]MCH8509124.1 helix-turn-helix transcriptional regulator [Phycisphaerales bacterium]
MPDEKPTRLFATMSPASIAPLAADPDICAVARDRDMKMLWCNAAYAANMGSTPERLVGTTLYDTMTPEQARERIELMRPVVETGQMHAHQQLWVGKRWLTRVWPLDPNAFGAEGYFVLITRLNDDLPLGGGEVHFARTADLGHLDILTPRELEVFYYLAAGMTAGDVARAMFRSEKTIGRHVENIHRKMGYTNRAQLVRDAVESGLIHFTSDEWITLIDPRQNH